MRPSTRAAAILCLAVALFARGTAADPPRPGTGKPDSGSSSLLREQLMHSWDTDFDGKVDPQEAEIARSKIRTKRIEQQRRNSIDPITGRKRGEIEDEKAGKADRRAAEAAPARPILGVDDVLDANAQGRADSSVLPSADPAGVTGRRGAASRDRRGAAGPESSWKRGGQQAAVPGANAADRGQGKDRTGIATGGVRAGAPPARPGYGAAAAPKETKPLNAGRPIGSLTPGNATTDPRTAPPRGTMPRGETQPRTPARPGQPAGPR